MPAKPPRVRRRPEDARAHILEAAEAVFAEHLPDAVGLREIAERAGTSHGLVTHYFGSYDRLVDAVLDRRLDAARELAFARLADVALGPEDLPLVSVLVDLLEDKTLMRLVAWTFLTGRGQALAKRGQLGRLVDAIAARFEGHGVTLSRTRVEVSVVAALAIMTGLGVAGETLPFLLGREVAIGKDVLRLELQRMLRAYMTAP